MKKLYFKVLSLILISVVFLTTSVNGAKLYRKENSLRKALEFSDHAGGHRLAKAMRNEGGFLLLPAKNQRIKIPLSQLSIDKKLKKYILSEAIMKYGAATMASLLLVSGVSVVLSKPAIIGIFGVMIYLFARILLYHIPTLMFKILNESFRPIDELANYLNKDYNSGQKLVRLFCDNSVKNYFVPRACSVDMFGNLILYANEPYIHDCFGFLYPIPLHIGRLSKWGEVREKELSPKIIPVPIQSKGGNSQDISIIGPPFVEKFSLYNSL